MADRFPIAYVAGSFPLRSETFVWREARELRRRGWTVHTFGLREPTEKTPEELADLRRETRYLYGARGFLGVGLEGFSLGRTNLWPLPHLRSFLDALQPGERTGIASRLKLPIQAYRGLILAAILRRLGVRHLHAHFAHAPTTVAMYAAMEANISFSFTGHANDLFQRRQLLKRKLQRASFVSCISEWHREWYQGIYPRGRYEIIRCGVPLEEYQTPPEPVSDLRVLTVARLVEKKGIDLLLRAAAEVKGVRLTVAGDGPEMAALRRLAADKDLQERVNFLGSVDSDRVPALLATHDVFALPCRPSRDGDRDGIPVALMEAMATGLSVIAGDLPAIRELVEDHQTGRLVTTVAVAEDKAVRELANILRTWRTERGDLRRLGAQGRQRVQEEFSLRANVDRLERSIRTAAGAP